MQTTTRDQAMKRRTAHQFVAGLGYVAHAEMPVPPANAAGGQNCEPPAKAADGSRHLLKHVGGGSRTFTWVAAERAWAPIKHGEGNRLAWTVDYLSKAGWEYVGKAKAKD